MREITGHVFGFSGNPNVLFAIGGDAFSFYHEAYPLAVDRKTLAGNHHFLPQKSSWRKVLFETDSRGEILIAD